MEEEATALGARDAYGLMVFTRAFFWYTASADIVTQLVAAGRVRPDLFTEDMRTELETLAGELTGLADPDEIEDDLARDQAALALMELAERALHAVRLEPTDDPEAGWGDGLWLEDYHQWLVEDLPRFGYLFDVLCPLFADGFVLIMHQPRFLQPGQLIEHWQLGGAQLRGRHYATGRLTARPHEPTLDDKSRTSVTAASETTTPPDPSA